MRTLSGIALICTLVLATVVFSRPTVSETQKRPNGRATAHIQRILEQIGYTNVSVDGDLIQFRSESKHSCPNGEQVFYDIRINMSLVDTANFSQVESSFHINSLGNREWYYVFSVGSLPERDWDGVEMTLFYDQLSEKLGKNVRLIGPEDERISTIQAELATHYPPGTEHHRQYYATCRGVVPFVTEFLSISGSDQSLMEELREELTQFYVQ